MAYTDFVGTDKTFTDAGAFSSWVDKTPEADVKQTASAYGVNPADFAEAYNLGAGTTFTADQASQYLGIPIPQPATTPSSPATPDRVTGNPGQNDLFQPGLVPVSNANSTGSSNASSGLPAWFGNNILNDLLPQLKQSYSNLPGQIDDWEQKNYAHSRQASKSLLDGHLTNVLADLAKRGMIQSSVASDAVGTAASEIDKNRNAADLGIASQSAQQRLAVPGILTAIAGLGQRSDSLSNQSSSSEQSNPLAPYELYSKMLLGMM